MFISKCCSYWPIITSFVCLVIKCSFEQSHWLWLHTELECMGQYLAMHVGSFGAASSGNTASLSELVTKGE